MPSKAKEVNVCKHEPIDFRTLFRRRIIKRSLPSQQPGGIRKPETLGACKYTILPRGIHRIYANVDSSLEYISRDAAAAGVLWSFEVNSKLKCNLKGRANEHGIEEFPYREGLWLVWTFSSLVKRIGGNRYNHI